MSKIQNALNRTFQNPANQIQYYEYKDLSGTSAFLSSKKTLNLINEIREKKIKI